MKFSNTTEGAATEKLAFSIPDAMYATGLCRNLVYAEIRAGRLRARKCGRRTVILRQDLEAFLQNMPSAGPSAAGADVT